MHITDLNKKKIIRQVSNQEYVGKNGDLFIFVVDLYRNQQIRKQLGKDDGRLHMTDVFLQGVEDTVLAVQNVVNAAESLNLGAVILGSIMNDPQKLITNLNLPPMTFPLLGLQVGVPTQNPQLKPRLPLSFTLFEDSYPKEVDIHKLDSYDKVVSTYYDLRDTNRRIDSFTKQVASKKMDKHITNRNQTVEVLHSQQLCLA
ncbi:oxygen-insensitive NADPH nitroreductase [Liquorilactobacillus oeni DSM 19972]|uniref:Oxygen-insensitive NADPH nitroreductase n=2 Tax=Liquorilactobacillus oeni TaxID=303241 RepID=A0A0R1M7S8_9LACO|nr:oxygen-insensitive NADPH nitroreductase [Liquorilactobacillus oeni DSM 19972]